MKKIVKTLLITVCAFVVFTLTSCGGGFFEKEYNVYSNIEYDETSGDALEIYIPKEKNNEGMKAILFISGENWNYTEPNGADVDLCKEYAEKGYITATMSYHDIGVFGNEEYTIWTILNDLTNAIAKLKSFTSELKINVTDLILHGRYSGGHIATLFAWSLPEKSAIPVKAVVNLAGHITFNESVFEELENYQENDGIKLACKLFGTTELEGYVMKDGTIDVEALTKEQKDEIVSLVSPLTYLGAESTPVIFAYSAKDKKLSYKHSEALEAALKDLGVSYHKFDYKNSGHSLALDPSISEDICDAMETYLK